MGLIRPPARETNVVPPLLSHTLAAIYPALLDVARVMLRIPGEGLESPEDIVQTALAIALERWTEFRGTTPEECAAWLKVIVRNEARLSYRRERRESRRRLVVAREDCFDPDLVAEFDPAQLTALQAAIAELTPLDRALLTLRGEQRKPFSVIARQLGQSAPTLRQRWSRCRERLQAALSPHDV